MTMYFLSWIRTTNLCYIAVLTQAPLWPWCPISNSHHIIIIIPPVFLAGFNPQWKESFQMIVHFPEMALLRFKVMDKDLNQDDFIGSFTLPVSSVVPGHRHVHLTSSGNKLPNASIFIHVQIQDYVSSDRPVCACACVCASRSRTMCLLIDLHVHVHVHVHVHMCMTIATLHGTTYVWRLHVHVHVHACTSACTCMHVI